MPGIAGLWDADTDFFVDSGGNAWSLWARPLAYIYDPTESSEPWIIEEDTAAAGSRIGIHDSSLFEFAYDDSADTVPDMNFQFVHNLCTIFP